MCAAFLRLCARYFAAHHDKHANKLCASAAAADAAPPTDRPTLFRTHVQPCKEIYLTPYLCIMLMWFATSYLPFAPCAYTVGVFAIFAGLARCAQQLHSTISAAANAERAARRHFCPQKPHLDAYKLLGCVSRATFKLEFTRETHCAPAPKPSENHSAIAFF